MMRKEEGRQWKGGIKGRLAAHLPIERSGPNFRGNLRVEEAEGSGWEGNKWRERKERKEKARQYN